MLIRALFLTLGLVAAPAGAEEIRIAAAADLRFAMNEIVDQFKAQHPNDRIEVSYGSSGKFQTQIQNGAPFDLFFSADIALPRNLVRAGLAGGEVQPYAIGRLVLWRPRLDAPPFTLADLSRPEISRIAIANPKHAPYGMRAVEVLKTAKLWGAVENRLVFGENISQAAQFAQTGNADVGIIALSLAITPEFTATGRYTLIPAEMHSSLEQGFVVLKGAKDKPLADAFANFFKTPGVRSTMNRYGFTAPDLLPK
ncbi:MAG: molybdate ABC transporter substrate-binding protein [Dechloromonas sp.]|nr:molybdate ABC transporter substrate-binding protein [Dechloromonas sp.]